MTAVLIIEDEVPSGREGFQDPGRCRLVVCPHFLKELVRRSHDLVCGTVGCSNWMKVLGRDQPRSGPPTNLSAGGL